MIASLPKGLGLHVVRADAWPCAVAPQPVVQAGVEVFVASLDVGRDSLAAANALLSEAELERARRFVFDRDRRRFIVARARLRELLAERLAISPAEVSFAYGPHGKPMLGPSLARAGLRFNVSHSEDLAVYAFARGREVGVDVEALRPMPDAADIAESAFSAAENRAFLALRPADRCEAFFNCWTRKEAFIKAIGDGLHHPLDAFDVSLAPGEPARLLRVAGVPGERCGWSLYELSPRSGFVGAMVIGNA